MEIKSELAVWIVGGMDLVMMGKNWLKLVVLIVRGTSVVVMVHWGENWVGSWN